MQIEVFGGLEGSFLETIKDVQSYVFDEPEGGCFGQPQWGCNSNFSENLKPPTPNTHHVPTPVHCLQLVLTRICLIWANWGAVAEWLECRTVDRRDPVRVQAPAGRWFSHRGVTPFQPLPASMVE